MYLVSNFYLNSAQSQIKIEAMTLQILSLYPSFSHMLILSQILLIQIFNLWKYKFILCFVELLKKLQQKSRFKCNKLYPFPSFVRDYNFSTTLNF